MTEPLPIDFVETDEPAYRPPCLLSGEQLDVYVINPRSGDDRSYLSDIRQTIALAGAQGATGILCFSGNDTQVDPWLTASLVASTPRRGGGQLTPLVALNPNTMPPFTAAKMISSIEQLHGAHVALNLITGVSSRDREVLNDLIGPDERYDRLVEYATIVTRLLSDARPVSFDGRYFRLLGGQLLPRSRRHLAPELFLAGHSEGADRAAGSLGAKRLRMLAPDFKVFPDVAGQVPALHLGIVTRRHSEEAWQAARQRYATSREREEVLRATLRHSDSDWKRRQFELAASHRDSGAFWLDPFRAFLSDCPYLVGSHEEVAEIVAGLLAQNVRTLVLDIAPDEQEFANVAEMLDRARGLHARSRP